MKKKMIMLVWFVCVAVLSTGCMMSLLLPKQKKPETPVSAMPTTERVERTPTQTPTETQEPTQEPRSTHPPASVTREEALSYMEDIEATDFTLETLTGETVSLSDYRGKVVLLNFWATWCPPCQREMPMFEQLMKDNDDFVVLAVDALPGEGVPEAEAEKAVRDFIKENGYTFPVLLDRDGGVASLSMYTSNSIPGNFVIDREGILRIIYPGAFSEEDLAIVIDYMRALDE